MKERTHKIYLVTNILNGKKYVGYTSLSIRKRWAQHRADAKRRLYHFSKAIEKYGPENFTIELLAETKNRNQALYELEPFYIRYYNTRNPKRGYNLSDGGDGPIGYRHTEEAKKRISEIVRSRGNKWAKGRKLDPDTIRKLSKDYQIIFPDGREIIISNISRFCRENHLKLTKMIDVAGGGRLSHRGFRCFKIINGKIDYPLYKYVRKTLDNDRRRFSEVTNLRSKTYVITDGHKVFIIKNLNQFCRNNNLNPAHMCAVAQNKRKHHKSFLCRRHD